MSSKYLVNVISREIAKPFVISNHYTKAFGKATLILGLWDNRTLCGVITFGQPSGRLVASSLGHTEKTCWEFLRMVVLDDCDCPRTYFMGRSIKILRQKFPQVQCLVTYADQTEGHDGTVYLAGSWDSVGLTAKKYHYVDKEGIRQNKRLCWDWSRKNNMTEKEAQEYLELEKVMEEPKVKFIKVIRGNKVNG
jgi:hypothetical protein